VWSDAPTLASSSCWESFQRERWWQKSPVTKESAKETVKTIAQGRPVFPVTCSDYARMLFHFACEAAGAAGTRLSLRPLFLEGKSMQDSGANVAARW